MRPAFGSASSSPPAGTPARPILEPQQHAYPESHLLAVGGRAHRARAVAPRLEITQIPADTREGRGVIVRTRRAAFGLQFAHPRLEKGQAARRDQVRVLADGRSGSGSVS